VSRPQRISIWQVLFLLTSMSWLLAPVLNHLLSPRSSLISQYETAGQPYALLFRACDLIAGLLVVAIALWSFRPKAPRSVWVLLLIAGVGMALDPILTTTCITHHSICREPLGLQFVLHASETVITAGALAALGIQDAVRRRKPVSIAIVVFQGVYAILYLTQLSHTENIATATQFIYQGLLFIWLAWFCREYIYGASAISQPQRVSVMRGIAALWTFAGGMFAIITSLADINVLGRVKELYFTNSTAWLAQHGVIVGVAMLYLARHIQRGELRARQILLVLLGLETLRYSLISPNAWLLGLYAVTFCALFAAGGEFQRGSAPLTWRLRAKDLAYLGIGLAVTIAVAFIMLDHDDRASAITAHTVSHYAEYVIHNSHLQHAHLHRTHRESALLAHTFTAFIAASLGAALWALFRPQRALAPPVVPPGRIHTVLQAHSDSSEDYFKLWPHDKQYFWSHNGFIAYKVVGPVAFALAGPITAPGKRNAALADFIAWTRAYGLRCCILPVLESELAHYQALNRLQIGARALIHTGAFVDSTSKDKWWRWKLNSARKAGYVYEQSLPPHNESLMQDIRRVSDAWLQHGGHQERGFTLGYFDEAYLQQCALHYLRDTTGRVVAFTNQLPIFGGVATQTIDLLRYLPETQNAMPFLLARVIGAVYANGGALFDLGFVPFAATKSPLAAIARLLSAGRFSAKGLEQFKNKFDPEWQPVYLAYDGDVADLALVALNLEKAMKLQKPQRGFWR
jgi:lysylphosphatidylglycerol synthetase-like protein (DUF2156 family)